MVGGMGDAREGESRTDVDVLIVGAGFAGMYMLHRARGLVPEQAIADAREVERAREWPACLAGEALAERLHEQIVYIGEQVERLGAELARRRGQVLGRPFGSALGRLLEHELTHPSSDARHLIEIDRARQRLEVAAKVRELGIDRG